MIYTICEMTLPKRNLVEIRTPGPTEGHTGKRNDTVAATIESLTIQTDIYIYSLGCPTNVNL